MPMQPSPMAETSRLLFPSLRFCIIESFLWLNVEASLPHLRAAVARGLATPVAGLLESALWRRYRGGRDSENRTAELFLIAKHPQLWKANGYYLLSFGFLLFTSMFPAPS